MILLMLPLIFYRYRLGLVLLGKSFDFFSILGLLRLVGMNIKNAIVLVEQIDLEAKTGQKAVGCCCPVLQRVVCPHSNGGSALPFWDVAIVVRRDVRRSMAATVMGGLLVASALTLFVASGSLLCHSRESKG